MTDPNKPTTLHKQTSMRVYVEDAIVCMVVLSLFIVWLTLDYINP